MLISFTCKAQLVRDSTHRASSSHVQVIQDPRLNVLIQKQVYLNMLALRHVSGYRIQVISTMDRSKALEAKAKLLQLFPDQPSYLTYQSPYFRVRVGNFRSRADAKLLESQLEPYFPSGIFIVRDHVAVTADQLLEDLSDHGTH